MKLRYYIFSVFLFILIFFLVSCNIKNEVNKNILNNLDKISNEIQIDKINDQKIDEKIIKKELMKKIDDIYDINLFLLEDNKLKVEIYEKNNTSNKSSKEIKLNITKYYELTYGKNIELITKPDKKDNLFLLNKKIELKILNNNLNILKLLVNNYDLKEQIHNNIFSFEIDKKTNILVELLEEFSIEVSTDEGKKIIEQNKNNVNFVLLDVRTEAEYAEGHLENSININMLDKDFVSKVNKLDKNKIYLVYCRTEVRSRIAVKKMKDNDFKYLHTMIGGFTKWATEEKDFIKPIYTKMIEVDVKTEKTNYLPNSIINIDITLYNLLSQTIRKGIITIKLYDMNNNLITTLVENKEVNDFGNFKISYQLDNRFVHNNKYYISVEANYKDYKPSKGLKIFNISSDNDNVDIYDFEKNKSKGIYEHLPIEDLKLDFLKDKFKTNVLKYQVMDKNQQIVPLYKKVDLSKKSILFFVYPGCGPCVTMWQNIYKYDFKDYNIVPIITSVDPNNPKASINDTRDVLEKLNLSHYFDTSYYDIVDIIWGSRMQFETTPKFLFVDEYGYLINAITHVDDIKKFVSLFEKTFNITEKISLKQVYEEEKPNINIPPIDDTNRKYLSFKERKNKKLFLDLYDENTINIIQEVYGNNIFGHKVKGFYYNHEDFMSKNIEDKNKITILAMVHPDRNNSLSFIQTVYKDLLNITSKVNFRFLDYSDYDRKNFREKVSTFMKSDDEINKYFLFMGSKIYYEIGLELTEPILLILDKYGQLIDITSIRMIDKIDKIIENVGNNVSNYTFDDRNNNEEYKYTYHKTFTKKHIINKSYKKDLLKGLENDQTIMYKDFFNNSKPIIIVFGGKGCGACKNFLSDLQKNYNELSKYVNIYYGLLDYEISLSETIQYFNSYNLPKKIFFRSNFGRISDFSDGYIPLGVMLDKNYRYINFITSYFSTDSVKRVVERLDLL